MPRPQAGGPETVRALFASAVDADPTRPLMTYYDDATGERTELSGATLDNWVAKTANLLADGCGLGAGDRATVLLAPHWQTAAVLLGCWSAGLTVSASGEPADVVFASVDRAGDAPPAADRYALGLHPMALPLRDPPAGFADYVTEVRAHGDRFDGVRLDPSVLAMPGTTQRELSSGAHERASALGLASGDRVLVDAGAHPDPLEWLLAPLAAGSTIVLCGHLDPALLPRRVDNERVTRTLA